MKNVFYYRAWWRSVLLVCLLPASLPGYAFLSHLELIDLAWSESIEPLLVARYPNATVEDLRLAHSYAYGGSVIQDLGYYPLGSALFSDLVHYVRTGDFVRNLIAESRGLNEWAFALGALAHYAGDTNGHPGINMAVALAFPKIPPAYGKEVTYEQNKTGHLRVEYGFDAYQVVRKRYAPEQYREAIGFSVARDLLDRAFLTTYGIPLRDVFRHPDLAIGVYRFAVGELLPKVTQAALVNRERQLTAERPSFSRQQFLFRVRRSEYRKRYGADYHPPGIGVRILAALLRILPHRGALRALDFIDPTPETEEYFVESLNAAVTRFSQFAEDASEGGLRLSNLNFDTGRAVAPEAYRLADAAYVQLTLRVTQRLDVRVDEGLRAHILAFFQKAAHPLAQSRRQWARVQQALDKLGAK